MTMDELNQNLIGELNEEMNSAVEYHQMAIFAKESGKEHLCMHLMAIAKDEMTHCRFIHEYAMEHGLRIEEEVENRYLKLKDAHKFR